MRTNWSLGELEQIKSWQAPDGYIWVCAACGKVSKERSGNCAERTHGWDESCFLNAILVKEDHCTWDNGRVTKVEEIAYGPHDEWQEMEALLEEAEKETEDASS